jgi:hypothetical protein
MIYLYVKTHNKTKLKYLGKTKSKDPHKYQGSGTYWRRHIKKHGYDVTTEILISSENSQEIKEAGILYSNLYNIVESSDWANLKLESGDGGWDLVNQIPLSEARIASSKKGGRKSIEKVNLQRSLGLIPYSIQNSKSANKRRKTIEEKFGDDYYRNIGERGGASFVKKFTDHNYRKEFLENHKESLPENHQKGNKNSQYGKNYKFMNDGVKNIKVEITEVDIYLNRGFIYGRLPNKKS